MSYLNTRLGSYLIPLQQFRQLITFRIRLIIRMYSIAQYGSHSWQPGKTTKLRSGVIISDDKKWNSEGDN